MKPPSLPTLKRYGLLPEDWLKMLDEQGGVCACCGKVPPSGKLVTDHLHVKGWRQMPPERRRLWVRGIVCHFCNRNVLRRGVTLERMRNAARYLERFQAHLAGSVARAALRAS